SWGYDRDEFNEALTPSTVLALLDELETADALNKHLELAIRKAEGCSEKLRKKAEAAEERVAELEAREVKLPQRYSMLHRTDFDEPYQAEMVYKQHQVLEALHDAGIRINGEV
ncbi:TPA: ead/Ea22-like family protein, partial [Enterobacter hormaechei subsp. xiangfangensis]|nr:ead/Ea22-like family protein [Enterobacter hormaechei subsp. xiangfangensis]HBM2860682.1 ead/Ea22-like family protein [Enterobacter hormaechei subsp. xiangfangensis]